MCVFNFELVIHTQVSTGVLSIQFRAAFELEFHVQCHLKDPPNLGSEERARIVHILIRAFEGTGPLAASLAGVVGHMATLSHLQTVTLETVDDDAANHGPD